MTSAEIRGSDPPRVPTGADPRSIRVQVHRAVRSPRRCIHVKFGCKRVEAKRVYTGVSLIIPLYRKLSCFVPRVKQFRVFRVHRIRVVILVAYKLFRLVPMLGGEKNT